MEDDKMANKIAKELLDWWQENRGKIKIYWQRAWNVNYELP
jgi:hypothetical protein